MNYELILSHAYTLLTAMAVLVFATNIIVEVVKSIIPKLPTSILAVLVALVVTGITVAALIAYKSITFVWYFVPGTIILGLFVAYAAMFGFDKFKEALEKIKAAKM